MTEQSQKIDRKLSQFTQAGYKKGRNYVVQGLWFATLNLFFVKWWMPRKLRPVILRLFGAKIGQNVFIRHNIRILWPWKLEIGNDCWLGEDLWILNLEPVKIGDDVCVSQGVMLCTGSHNFKSISFGYRNAPIVIEDGVWLAVQVLVLPGVTVGRGSTILAKNTVSKNVTQYSTIK
jgi:putative colanic acid biosynthesis acetyltransferase WcaF